MLSDPNYLVPTTPPATTGVAWLRSSVARFSNGPTHDRRRALAVASLAAIDPDDLRALALERGTSPVEVLAEALGLPCSVADDVAVIAKSYQPHTTITPEADQATDRLARLLRAHYASGLDDRPHPDRLSDESAANLIALLVQACDATAALVANTLAGRSDPPVPKTRRIAPDGSTVEIDLTDTPFGAGPHACPGRLHALALADGLVAASRKPSGPRT
ncbi:hypothetical protein [Kribbella sp. NPDC051620]|uniref:hypothetical protein n=1 Tax=Kribbella sp. NPDC051620 TaxID=3364120 RepID=UPI003793B9E1